MSVLVGGGYQRKQNKKRKEKKREKEMLGEGGCRQEKILRGPGACRQLGRLFLLQNVSPEGRCGAYPVGLIVLLLFYPPQGDAKHIQLGSNCFYICFIPKGRCEAYPVGVQLFLLVFYFGLGNELWKSKVTQVE